MAATAKPADNSAVADQPVTISSDSLPKHEDSYSHSEPRTVPKEKEPDTIGIGCQPKDDDSISYSESLTVTKEKDHVTTEFDGQPKNDDSDSYNDSLTVERKPKKTELDGDRAGNNCLVAVKVLLALLIFFSFLSSLVFSKVSAVRLAQELYRHSSVGRQQPMNISSTGGNGDAKEPFALVLVIVTCLVPYLVGTVKSLFAVLSSNDHSKVNCSSLPLNFICASFEVIGISMFVIIVIPCHQDQGLISLVVTNSILLAPTFQHAVIDPLCDWCRRHRNEGKEGGQPPNTTEEEKKKKNCLLARHVAAFVLQVAGEVILLVIYILEIKVSYQLETKLCLVASMLLISVSWLPELQKRQILPKDETTQGNGNGNTSGDSAHFYGDRARHIASLISNIFKLLVTGPVMILTVFIRSKTGYSLGSFPIEEFRLITLQTWTSPAYAALIDWFALNVVSSFAGYVLAIVACKMCMQKAAFATPITLATLVTPIASYLTSDCDGLRNFPCSLPPIHLTEILLLAGATVSLWIAQILLTLDIFDSQTTVLEKERHLFWIAGYNSVFLEQWMLLGRRTRKTDQLRPDPSEMHKKVRVFICTTMYHEKEHEMKQLLVSLAAVNKAQPKHGNFEAHIFFDDGIKGQKLNDYALQLVSLISSTLGVDFKNCTKIDTPYGMKLNCRLPSLRESAGGMHFSVHLKDSLKVKNKKRWSQIMYMSMVLDYILKGDKPAKDKESFILATDADVKFNQNSIEALLDHMLRNKRVGAVCARTYPMGSGPVVWYQLFDYAVGHWLQKAAEHVLGTVLCCPGCFSMYRIKALNDVLPEYGSNVKEALDFLTKDMGEDRWLCTLMVQKGWNLEYSAVAVNSTYCPETFEEFYKQRRRWIASTFANQVLLMAGICNRKFPFWIYQALLIVSTAITPSMTILFISGGFEYATNVSQIASIVFTGVIVIIYVFICWYMKREHQLTAAVVLTVLFILIMGVVTIGTIVHAVGEFKGTTCAPSAVTYPASATSPDSFLKILRESPNKTQAMLSPTTSGPEPCKYTPVIPGTAINFSTLYLVVLIGMYIITGLLHLTEFPCLFAGLWYILCLPSGCIFLLIYSLCNIDDVTWGTREEKSTAVSGSYKSFAERFKATFSKMCQCCKPKELGATPVGATVTSSVPSPDAAASSSQSNSATASASRPTNVSEANQTTTYNESRSENESRREPSGLAFNQQPNNEGHANVYLTTDQWFLKLGSNFEQSQYAQKFIEEGYTDTSFIAGITETDLKALQINDNHHRKFLLQAIQHLEEPDFEAIETKNPAAWLEVLGLKEYTQVFMKNGICAEQDLQKLKNMKKKKIEKTLEIRKKGHMRRLQQAIMYLSSPPERMRRIQAARDLIQCAAHCNIDRLEEDFWETLQKKCLLPERLDSEHKAQLEAKLKTLRNHSMIIFAVVTALMLILMLTLEYTASLYINGVNPLGVVFLFLFGLVTVIQFIGMICHRIMTWMHYVARTPFCVCKKSTPEPDSSGNRDALP